MQLRFSDPVVTGCVARASTRKTAVGAAAIAAVLSWFAVTGAGCGVPYDDWAFHRALLDADRLADDRRNMEAAEAYWDLAFDARRDDLLRYIRFRIALMYEREGRFDEALALYALIYRQPASLYDDYAANALLRTGYILRDELGRTGEGLDVIAAVIRTFPDTMYADDALTDLLRYWRDRERPDLMLAFLGDVYPPLFETEIADNLVYWSARLLDEDYDDCDEAMPLYRIVITRFHRSGLVDDSIWRTALCLRRNDRIDEEYALLLDFIDGREVSWVMADYDSEYYGDTIRRLAEIHEQREQIAEAIEMWRRFQETFPLSLRVDDVQFHIMELQAQLGDTDGMFKSLRWLERNYPDSRFIARGRDLLQATREGT